MKTRTIILGMFLMLAAGCVHTNHGGIQATPAQEAIQATRQIPAHPPEALSSRTIRQASFVQPAPSNPIQAPPLPLKELTLTDLEQIALANNPSLAEATARVEATQGAWLQVGLPPNTVLGYSGQQLGSGGQAEQQGVFIGQEFVRGDKLALNRRVAAQEIAKAEQLLAAQQQRVRTDVRLGYYEVLIAQRREQLAHQLRVIAEQAYQAADARFQAKDVSRLDVLRANVELKTAMLKLKTANNAQTAAWSRLAAVLGAPGMPPRPLSGDLEAVSPRLNPDNVLQRLIGESPEMAAAAAEIERARWAVDRAHAEPIPNVDVQAVLQSDNGTGSSNANLQVTVPIPWRNRNQGGIQQAHADLTAAERSRDRLELDLKQRLADAYQRYANARNQVEDYSKPDGILADAKATLDLIREGYQAGELPYLELINAQRTYSQTNLAYIESLGEYWAARIEIEGLLLSGSLQDR